MHSAFPKTAILCSSLISGTTPSNPSPFTNKSRFVASTFLAFNLLLLTLANALPAWGEPIGDPRLFSNSTLPIEVYNKIRRTDSFLSGFPQASQIGIDKVVDATGKFLVLSVYNQQFPWNYYLYIFKAKTRSLYGSVSLPTQKYRSPVIQFLRFGTNIYLATTYLNDTGSGVYRRVTTYYALDRGGLKRGLTIPEKGDLMVGTVTPIEYSFWSSIHRRGNDLLAEFHVEFYVFDPTRSMAPPVKPFISDSFHITVVRNGFLQNKVVGDSKAHLLVKLFTYYDFKAFDRLYHEQVRRLIENGGASSQWVKDYHYTVTN